MMRLLDIGNAICAITGAAFWFVSAKLPDRRRLVETGLKAKK
jgi:hypothetical protein